MSAVRIAPSILSADFGRLADEVRALEAARADVVHVDVMDGHFVPNLTIGPVVIEAVRKITRLPLDVHLMIEDPDRSIDDYRKAGADWLTVHAEASVHLHRSLQRVRATGARVGVSLNPATPLSVLDHVLEDIDYVLLMSVNPGFGGQSYIPQVTDKIRTLAGRIKQRGLSVDIEVDGGVKAANARAIAAAGARIFVAGSAVFGAKDYGVAIADIRREAEAGARED